MSVISDRPDQLVDPDSDLLPGSTDVEWAERAYRHHSRPVAAQPFTVRRLERRVMLPRRLLAAVLVVLFVVVGLVLLLTTQANAPTTTRPQMPPAPASVTKPSAVTPQASRPSTLVPPLLRPSSFPFPEFMTPLR